MRRLFATDDFLARHPRLLLALIAACYVLTCTAEAML